MRLRPSEAKKACFPLEPVGDERGVVMLLDPGSQATRSNAVETRQLIHHRLLYSAGKMIDEHHNSRSKKPLTLCRSSFR